MRRALLSYLCTVACAALAFGCGGALAPEDADRGGEADGRLPFPPSGPPGASTVRQPLGRLCDGSNELRLVYRNLYVPESGEEFFGENGAPLLVVDGRCQFAAHQGGQAPTVVGHLTPEREEELVAGLRLREWSKETLGCLGDDALVLAGEPLGAQGHCAAGSDASVASARWLRSAVWRRIDEMTARYPEQTGAVRFVVRDISSEARYPHNTPSLLWPLSVAPSGDRRSRLSTPEDGERLRAALRARSGARPAAWRDEELRFGTDDGGRYAVYFRDVLPWEGPDGRVPFPPPF